MKRFLLFHGARWYPQGGWEDFQGDFDDFGSATTAMAELRNALDDYDRRNDWAQIVDTTLAEDDDQYFHVGKIGRVIYSHGDNRPKKRKDDDDA